MHYLLPLLIVACLSLHATKTKQERMLCELETVANFFETSYGLKEYKAQLYQWNAPQVLEQARNTIAYRENISTKEFHQILLQYTQSMRDYHVGITFSSTERARLTFAVKEAENRYFIIDEDSKSAVAELISFNGLPTHFAVEALQKRFFNYSNPKTDRALATKALTFRHSGMGMPVLKGPIDLELKIDDKIECVKLDWEHKPEKIIFAPMITATKAGHKWSKYEFTTPFYYKFEETDLFAAEDSFVPTFGDLSWRASGGVNNPFSGAIFILDTGEPIGYVRIPHYKGSDNDVELFRQTIEHLQKKTKALVIDQTSNPGGYPFYTLALVTTLIDKPIDNIKQSILLNPTIVQEALNDAERLSEKDALTFMKHYASGYALTQGDINELRDLNKKIVEEWTEGKILSSISPIFGIEKLKPNPNIHYTKPIIVLTDELCFSGGDVLPSLLQDSKRALIFGQTTAGAGGCVQSYEYPNYFGVESIEITRSVLYRANGEPLENVGVTPDIMYEITVDDLKNGYRGYRTALIEAIRQIL